MTKSPTTKRPRLALWLKLIVTVGLVAYLYVRLRTQMGQVFASLANAQLAFLVAALLNNLIVRYVMACQTSFAMRVHGVHYPALRLFGINLRTLFYGFFLPGDISSMGVKWYLISRIGGLRAQTFATLAYLRLLNLTVLVSVGLIAMVAKSPFDSLVLLLGCLGLLLVLILATIAIHLRAAEAVFAWIKRVPFYRHVPAAVAQRINTLHDAFLSFSSLDSWSVAGLWAMGLAIKIAITISFWLISMALGLDLGLISLLWIHSVVELVQLLPISFSGIGTREISVIYMLGLFAISEADGLSFSLIIFGLRIVVVLVGGLIILADWLSLGRES